MADLAYITPEVLRWARERAGLGRTELAAKFDRLPAVHEAERVADHVRLVVASRRKAGRAAEVEAAGNRQLRRPL